MALGDANQTVAAGAGTKGYTYTNGVLTSVGGVPTGYGTAASTPSLTTQTPSLTSSSSSAVPSTTPGLTGTSAMSGDQLNTYLNNEFDNSGTDQTIMGTYNAGVAANTQAAEANAQVLTDTGQANISNQNYQGALNTQDAITASKGLINPGAMTVIQNQSNNIVRQLTQQMNDALANNQASLASTNANLIAQENTNMITARQNFLSNYFSTQQEARAEASFQTPEQTQVLTLSGQYPNAGITPTDTLAQAEAKITASPQYQLTQAATKSTISAQNAAAGLSGAQATQTQIINNLMNGVAGSTDAAVQQLMLNQSNPTLGTSAEQLQANLANMPGGPALYNKIIQAAQAQGYNQAGATLGNTAATTNTQSLSSGGIGTAGTELTNFINSFTGKSGITPANPFSLAPTQSSIANPTAGQTTTLNGTTYKWNGSQWQPQ